MVSNIPMWVACSLSPYLTCHDLPSLVSFSFCNLLSVHLAQLVLPDRSTARIN